jgi:hypothetical protein
MGGEQVMRAQLERLLADAQRPNITVRLLPFSAGAHHSVAGSFVVLAFPHSDDNDLVCVESHLGMLYLEKEHDVEVYEQIFDALVGLCMSARDSVTLVTKFLSDH